MKLIFTDHLETRITQREIPLGLVEEIFEKSEENYWDNLRNRYIVISSVNYKGKQRKLLAAYDRIGEDKKVITVHPISDEGIQRRLFSGRWNHERA